MLYLVFADVGTLRVYDPKITSGTPTITRTGGATVYGTNQLRTDIMALHAHGGADCPEYGMTGTLQAISGITSVNFPSGSSPLHHIILLTDATAKDDSMYNAVISQAQQARITIHFFYSGGGCGGGGFANYETVRTATDGIAVTSFADFSLFGSFIQQYNQQQSFLTSSSVSRRRRQSNTVGSIFSAYATCHNVSVSIFSRSIAVLVRTTQPNVIITKPDGSTHTLGIGGDLGLSEETHPQAGTWIFCASPGTLQVAVNAPIELEMSISFTRSTADGVVLPSSDTPFACELSLSLSLSLLSFLAFLFTL